MKNNFVTEIIKNKTPCYFISPHLDDAAFSAGGLMVQLSGKVPLTVVNVFTTAGDGKNTLSAKAYLKQCHSDDATKLYRERRLEDNRALTALHARVINLNYVDALWRTRPGFHLPIQELNAVYPTYRFHIARGKISQFDTTLIEEIGTQLASIVTESNALIFCPVGYGAHVDHLVVRTMCQKTFAPENLVYWADFPYVLTKDLPDNILTEQQCREFTVEHSWRAKVQLCKQYPSQFAPVIGEAKKLSAHEIYYRPQHLVAPQSRSLQTYTATHLNAFFNAPKDYLYSVMYASSKPVNLKPFSDIQTICAENLMRKIKRALPSVVFNLIGSTGLKIAGQGDINLLIPCQQKNIQTTTKQLSKLFGPPTKKASELVQWKLRIGGIPIDLDLIDPNSDRYHRQMNLFHFMSKNPEALRQYEEFKWAYQGTSEKYYTVARINFFTNIIKKSVLPAAIGDYQLVSIFTPKEHHTEYQYGRYVNTLGHHGFAKYWSGTEHDRSYHWLKNEINAYQLLSKVSQKYPEIAVNKKVKIPQFLGYQETAHELLLLIEEVNGIEFSAIDVDKKVVAYEAITKYLQSISEKINVKEEKNIVHRTSWYWAAIMPFIVVKAIILHPRASGKIIKGLQIFYQNLGAFLKDKTTSLIHRDLGDWNLRQSGTSTWLLDFQLSSFAHPYIDLVIILERFWRNKAFIRSMLATLRLKEIYANPKEKELFRDYGILFCIYDLSVADDETYHNSLAYLDSLITEPKPIARVVKNRRPLKQFLLTSVFLIIASCLLFLSVRGRSGNPAESELTNPKWEVNGPFELSPERGRFALTYSLVENKSFFFSLPLAKFVVPDLGYHNGQYVSLFAPAVSYIAIPGYEIGKMFGDAQVGSFAIISVFALINAYLIYRISRRLGAHPLAGLLAGALFLFATPAYAYGVNLYQHHISTFLILASVYLVLSFESIWSLGLIWLLCAFSIPVDYPNLVLMLPIGLYASMQFFRTRETKSEIMIDFHYPKIISLITVLLPLGFFLWFNQVSYGNPLQFSGTITSVGNIGTDGRPAALPSVTMNNAASTLNTDQSEKSAIGFFKTRNILNGLYILLVSPDRGTLRFAPLMLLAIIGIIVASKKYPSETTLLTSIIIANLLLYAMWGDPWGGWAFGARYLIPSYAVLAIFLGVALSKYRKNMFFLMIFLVLSGYSLYVNTAGALSANTNPPEVQVLALEKLSGVQEKYSYDRNIDFLKSGSSKSFVYESWVSPYLTSWQYFEIMTGTLTALVVIGLIGLYLSHEEGTHV